MSIASGPINETEQAAEKGFDHAADRINNDTPSIFRKILDIFTEYEFAASFALGLRKKQ